MKNTCQVTGQKQVKSHSRIDVGTENQQNNSSENK